MKNNIKGKLFRLGHKTFNTKDVLKIESEVLYHRENSYFPQEKTIASIGVKVTFNDNSKTFINYEHTHFSVFKAEVDKAFLKMKEYQKKINKR